MMTKILFELCNQCHF